MFPNTRVGVYYTHAIVNHDSHASCRTAINDHLKKAKIGSLPKDFDLEPLTREGRVTTRICKYLHDNHAFNADHYFKTLIGNLYNTHYIPSQVYTFDFADKFDWKAGDFNDDGSCFFTSRASQRGTLERNGAWAVRFHGDNKSQNSRAWMYPIKEGVALFNAYGPLSVRKISTILSGWTGIPNHVGCRPHWPDDYHYTNIFINNGECAVIGKKPRRSIVTLAILS